MINEDELPNPRPPLMHPPLMDLSFAALGWLHRTAAAVGSDRFVEALDRSRFYLGRCAGHAVTPAERAVVDGLWAVVDGLITANALSRVLLSDSVSGMCAADATEFVELCEADHDPGLR